MKKKITRREVLIDLGLGAGALTGVLTLVENAGAAVQKEGLVDADGLHTLTLRIKVPKNVEVQTKIEKTTKAMTFNKLNLKSVNKSLNLDLTSDRTNRWFKGEINLGDGQTNCCCVRG